MPHDCCDDPNDSCCSERRGPPPRVGVPTVGTGGPPVGAGGPQFRAGGSPDGAGGPLRPGGPSSGGMSQSVQQTPSNPSTNYFNITIPATIVIQYNGSMLSGTNPPNATVPLKPMSMPPKEFKPNVPIPKGTLPNITVPNGILPNVTLPNFKALKRSAECNQDSYCATKQ